MHDTYLPTERDDGPGVRFIQPALLDRLTLDPDNPRRAAEPITPDDFKESLRRDLEWIFRARCQPDHELLAQKYPLLASSAMNYGIPSFRDDTLASLRPQEVVAEFRRAILRFEPRIRPSSLKVRIHEDSLAAQRTEGGCVLYLMIEGEAMGFPDPLAFRAKVNVATGECLVGDERRA